VVNIDNGFGAGFAASRINLADARPPVSPSHETAAQGVA
jgi:hypothetical protein